MSKMEKGAHEDAVERARALLDKGVGMSEIKEVTHLTEDEITKVKKRMVDKS